MIHNSIHTCCIYTLWRGRNCSQPKIAPIFNNALTVTLNNTHNRKSDFISSTSKTQIHWWYLSPLFRSRGTNPYEDRWIMIFFTLSFLYVLGCGRAKDQLVGSQPAARTYSWRHLQCPTVSYPSAFVGRSSLMPLVATTKFDSCITYKYNSLKCSLIYSLHKCTWCCLWYWAQFNIILKYATKNKRAY